MFGIIFLIICLWLFAKAFKFWISIVATLLLVLFYMIAFPLGIIATLVLITLCLKQIT